MNANENKALILERARQALIQSAGLGVGDLSDPVVAAELERIATIIADYHTDFDDGREAPIRASITADLLRVVCDHQRQKRALKPDNKPITLDELGELRRLWEASTPGMYLLCHNGECSCAMVSSEAVDVVVHAPALDHDGEGMNVLDSALQKADARFFAAAHNVMPRLLNTLDALLKLQEAAQS